MIGRPSEQNDNEEVVAFVQLQLSSPVTTKELAEYAAAQLAPYKRPSEIIVVPEMPVTPTGKVAKGDLTKLFACTRQGKLKISTPHIQPTDLLQSASALPPQIPPAKPFQKYPTN